MAPAPTMFNASIVLVNHDREVRVREEHLAQDAREQEDEHERDEPADGLPHLEEDEGSERSQDAPEPDPSGGEEPAHEHLPGRRRERGCRGAATTRRNRKLLVRAKTTNEPTETAK